MRVVDLKVTPLPELWNKVIEQIAEGNDTLKNNYLSIDFSDFLSFTCVIHSDSIIAFSGLQYDVTKWGPTIARCSSRMWIHPQYRFNGMTKFSGGEKFLNSYYCVPIQLAVAKSSGISTVFVSREHNPTAFQEYLNLLKINTGATFNFAADRYWVCGPVRESSCLQYVGIHHLTTDGDSMWRSYMEDNREIVSLDV